MKNWKTTQYNFSRDYWLVIIEYWLSSCFVFCYYLITPSMHFSLYILVIEAHVIDLQITFHVVKQSHGSDFKSYMFTLYHSISLPISVLSHLRFILWSPPPPPSLVHLPRVQLYRNVTKNIRFEVIYHPLLNIFWIYWMLI